MEQLEHESNPNAFKRLLSQYPDVVEKLQQITNGELRPGRRSRSEFINDLTDIWFQRKGFEHIFCGEIYNQNDIGGLHFYGRYLQLQQQGIGGRLPNNTRRQEVVPGIIYTMGVVIKQKHRTVTDVIKGYGYLSNSLEILLDVTQIHKLQGNSEGACIYQVRDRDTGQTFPAVFVRREQAIITFYPDATPKGRQCKTNSKNMILETEMLLLREFVKSDIQEVLTYQSDPLYLRYYPWTQRTEKDVRDFIETFIIQQSHQPRTKFQLAIILKTENRLIGNCGIRINDIQQKEANIGYELNSQYWRNGYATEAAKNYFATWLSRITNAQNLVLVYY